MKRYLLILMLIHITSVSADQSFDFVVLGDTAYTEESYADYEALIDRINADSPDFAIHVGDTLGYQDCSDSTFDIIDTQFDRFEVPLVYTPGDNEWTDCRHEGYQQAHDNSEWDVIADHKLGRLAELRKRYFSTDESLGKNRFKLKRQSKHGKDMYNKFVENTYWIHNDVLFATVHIVGSHDSFHPYMPKLTSESIERRGANYSWITGLLNIAELEDVKAIVIAGHAELFERGERLPYNVEYSSTRVRGGDKGPYIGYVHALAVLSSNFDKPILYTHGDFHRFVVDRPMATGLYDKEQGKLRFDNLLRMQVPGHPQPRAVKVTVDPGTDSVFSFSLLH